MNAGSYVGRIGGLAVALGVGAAVFTGTGVAYAEPAGSESSSGADTSSSGTDSTSGSDTGKKSNDTKKSNDAQSSTESDSGDDSTAESDESDPVEDTPKKKRRVWADLFGGDKGATEPDEDTTEPETPDADGEAPPQSTGDTTDADKQRPGRHRLWSRLTDEPTTSATDAASDTSSDTTTEVDAEPKENTTSLTTVAVDEPQSAAIESAVSTTEDTQETTTTEVTTESEETTTSSVNRPIATLIRNILNAFSGNSGSEPAAASPFAWLLAAASRREVGAEAETQDPTMVWNGYNVVAVGEPTISSFYGEYTMVPAFPGIVQGEQDFDLVDPDSGETVATVHGLVTINNDLGFGNRLLQIVVTDVTYMDSGVEIGIEEGDIPAPGSVFASVSNGRVGTSYSAIDNPDGEDVVTYKWVTPRLSFNLNPDPFNLNFSSADFLYDNEGVNRPIYTKDGYVIKPITDTVVWTGYAGYQPLFNAIQGTGTFGLYDEDTDELIGTFEGVVTVTSDFWGTTSEAILVTDAEGDVGVEAGQIPPVGTIYNIIYWTADPSEYLLYYSKPAEQPDANVYKTLLVDINRKGEEKVAEIKINFDGASPPVRESLDVPGANGTGYSFVPTSEKVYSGVNGLPPREAIVQGHQQFDVYDSNGKYLGNVDAAVSTQWDLSGNSSEAILVIDVNDVADDSSIGTDKGEVPPVGSVFNFKYNGTSGFGEAYYAMPTESGESKISYQIVTPFGGIPWFSNYDAAKDLDQYNYYNPFGNDLELNLLSAAGAESGAVLGASQSLCVLGESTDCEADAA